MHLRNVEIFCDVVTHGSFSRAAEVHSVSQPSVSQAVNALERELGCQLIDRSKRPLELTPAGEVYFDGCRKILESFRHVEDRVQQLRNKIIGRVRLAAIYSVGLLQMDAYAKQYRASYPDVVLQLDYLHPDEVYARVQSDEADLGIVSFPRVGGEIASIPWQEQEMVVVASPEHRWADRESIAARELDGEAFVGFTPDLQIRKQIDRWLKHAEVSVEIIHAFDNVENIKRAVEIGSGVALLPLPTVRREVETGSLEAIRVEGMDWRRPLGIVHRRHRTLTTPARMLVELLRGNPEPIATSGSEMQR